jgi:hypothetical protein
VLHLWHQPADRAVENKHWEHIASAVANGRTISIRGISSCAR